MVDKCKETIASARRNSHWAGSPNVERPRLPDANVEQPMHDEIVEYPDGASGDLVREMKEPDPASGSLFQRRDR